MPTYRGFVRSLQVRDDGWVEFVLQAVHAGNGTQTFFISNLDGDLATAHRRLAHLSLLRDALMRILPVELEYRQDEEEGDVIEDLTVYPRPSLEGRRPSRRLEGTVIGLSIAERGPEQGLTPYTDESDMAGVTLLADSGAVEQVVLDLQRPDPMTAHAMLGLLREAFRTRRPVAVIVSAEQVPTGVKNEGGMQPRRQPFMGRAGGTAEGGMSALAANQSEGRSGSFVQACGWLTVPEETLEYLYAFVERLGQRYESYEESEASQLSHVRVLYTTTPSQTPEGDISDNGTFAPVTAEAWVHADSPLLARLEAALRDSLQVKLGLKENRVHEVELVSHLGSAARPIWIEITNTVLPPEQDSGACSNVPTIQTPTGSDFDAMPLSVSWRGQAYFNEGIWRFVIRSRSQCKLLVDGKSPCCPPGQAGAHLEGMGDILLTNMYSSEVRGGDRSMCHTYLCGMHQVELVITGRTCAQPFQLLVYRIR